MIFYIYIKKFIWFWSGESITKIKWANIFQMIKYWVPKEDELKLLSFIDYCLVCLLSEHTNTAMMKMERTRLMTKTMKHNNDDDPLVGRTSGGEGCPENEPPGGPNHVCHAPLPWSPSFDIMAPEPSDDDDKDDCDDDVLFYLPISKLGSEVKSGAIKGLQRASRSRSTLPPSQGCTL